MTTALVSGYLRPLITQEVQFTGRFSKIWEDLRLSAPIHAMEVMKLLLDSLLMRHSSCHALFHVQAIFLTPGRYFVVAVVPWVFFVLTFGIEFDHLFLVRKTIFALFFSKNFCSFFECKIRSFWLKSLQPSLLLVFLIEKKSKFDGMRTSKAKSRRCNEEFSPFFVSHHSLLILRYLPSRNNYRKKLNKEPLTQWLKLNIVRFEQFPLGAHHIL